MPDDGNVNSNPLYKPAAATMAPTDPVVSPTEPSPIPMRLCCERCGEIHVDEGEFATKPHHTHACQYCGLVWRPALVATVGVQFLPGFKNDIES